MPSAVLHPTGYGAQRPAELVGPARFVFRANGTCTVGKSAQVQLLGGKPDWLVEHVFQQVKGLASLLANGGDDGVFGPKLNDELQAVELVGLCHPLVP